MVVLLLSGLVRVAAGPGVLFVGTVAGGLGIAVANVMLPALVRRDFAGRAGHVTGLYTLTLAVFATLAALTAVPIMSAARGHWQAPLLVWGAVAAVPIAVLAPRLRRRHRPDAGATPPRASLALLRHRTARNLTLFMGLQSIGFYAMVSWLPSLLQDAGISAATAGALLSLGTLLGIPTAFVTPIIAARLHHQHLIAVATTVLTAAGWAGLLVAPAHATVVWAVLLGVGTGSSFPLALLLIALRAADPAQVPELSTTVQGGGYLVAAGGPFLVGVLHEVAGGWVAPLAFLLVLNLIQGVSGWTAGRARKVTDHPQA
jgi:CP family cyanate transporter-like MFS transporter